MSQILIFFSIVYNLRGNGVIAYSQISKIFSRHESHVKLWTKRHIKNAGLQEVTSYDRSKVWFSIGIHSIWYDLHIILKWTYIMSNKRYWNNCHWNNDLNCGAIIQNWFESHIRINFVLLHHNSNHYFNDSYFNYVYLT